MFAIYCTIYTVQLLLMHSEVMRLVVQALELEVESSKIVVELTFVLVALSNLMIVG